jgi:hypothetical protein
MLKIALRATLRSNHVGHSKLRRSWAGQVTSYLIAWALSLAAPTASNRAYASDQVKVTIYRLSEQDACGPGGYARNSCIRIGADRFDDLMRSGRLTLIKDGVFIPPPNIELRPSEMSYILKYSELIGDLDATKKESALIVVEWPDRMPRSFGVARSESHPISARSDSYARPSRSYLRSFYHEPLDHLNPERGIKWTIAGGSKTYALQFQ